MKTIKKPIVVILSVCILMSVFSTSVFADKKKEPVDGRTYRKGVNMVSMGDSFASGESIGSYGTGSVYDEDFLAHRSYYSWSSLLKLPGNGGGRMRDYKGTKWQFVACSGATTENIYGTQTKEYNHNGQKGSHDLPPQLDIFSSGKIDPKEVDYVTLSIGGNDVDFAGIIKRATLNMEGYSGFCADAISDKINHFDDPGGTRDKLIDTYRAIAKQAPNATIIVTGYPPLLDPKCADAQFFNEDEAEWVNMGVHYFNSNVKLMVEELKKEGIKIEFADIEAKFRGHEAYSKDSWINGLEFGPDTRGEELDDWAITSMNSIHPNFDGVKAYAECVQEVIDKVEKEKEKERKKLGLDDEGNPITEESSSSESSDPEDVVPDDSNVEEKELDYGYPNVYEIAGSYDDGLFSVTDYDIPEAVLKSMNDKADFWSKMLGCDDEDLGCEVTEEDITVHDAAYPFTLEYLGDNTFKFTSSKLGTTTAYYDPYSGALSVDPINCSDMGGKAIVRFHLTCNYDDVYSRSAVIISGTASFDFEGDYKGMYFDGDFSGSKDIPYYEVEETTNDDWFDDWPDNSEEWDPELWDEWEHPEDYELTDEEKWQGLEEDWGDNSKDWDPDMWDEWEEGN
ncbi:MAG: SGNH/GDSL hydrolase family protein [Saccharofermentans sp.]|nr:SGNH/GDSL hydrolase family protein [Saccharofermentans sp.]